MNIVQFIGTLGLGSLIGIVIKAFLDRNNEKKKLLFESRVKAYAGITGRINNHFLEPDINKKSEALRFAQINAILSETYLLSSRTLKKLLDEYISKVNALHNSLRDKDDKKSGDQIKEISKLAIAINKQMRTDLYL